MRKWVGTAWSRVGKMKKSVVQSFKNCDLLASLMDHEVNNETIPNYEMPSPFPYKSLDWLMMMTMTTKVTPKKICLKWHQWIRLHLWWRNISCTAKKKMIW